MRSNGCSPRAMCSGRRPRSHRLRATARCRRRSMSRRRSSAAICHRRRECKSVRTGSTRPRPSPSANSRPRRHRRSKSAMRRSDSRARHPWWRSSATSSMPSRSPTRHAGPRSNACSATSSTIGKAPRAIPIPSSRVTAGAARSRRAARGEICTTTTSASAPAAATMPAPIARPSVRHIISTAFTTARSRRSGPPRTRSNGGSASERERRRI